MSISVCSIGPLGPLLTFLAPSNGIFASGNSIVITAAVGSSALNRQTDVAKTQDGLNGIRPDQGGSWPRLVVDGICGPKTLASIRAFQQRHFGTADGRFDPGQRSIAKLNECLASSGTVANAAGFSQPFAPSLLELAEETRANALAWLKAAVAKMTSDKAVLNQHFHLDQAGGLNDATYTLRIGQTLMRMMSALNRTSLFTLDPGNDPNFAYAFLGGYDRGGMREDGGAQRRLDLIHLCTPFGTLWLKSRTAVIVHELAHFVGGQQSHDSIKHFAHELPAPDGWPQEGCPRNYKQLKPEEAMRNAATYATYAIHAFYGWDNRAGSF